MNIINELKWRGLLNQITNENKLLSLKDDQKKIYCGFDPTADSLHVGSLMMIITLKRFINFGYKTIALIGGSTGMIGDPSFKAKERKLQSDDQVIKNIDGIQKQLSHILDKNTDFVNNSDWLKDITIIDFLRDIGKHFNLSYLLSKECISTRIQSGLSITEFFYTMLQAYDFYHLYKTKNCSVQIGGSDQWGNIISGIDFIKDKYENSNAVGLTIPLLVKNDGTKFGKSESGTIWLDKNRTNEFEFYQFWVNQPDDECEKMLKMLTFLTEKEINDLKEEHKLNPKNRIMQKSLAKELTIFVHKEKGYELALEITNAFFNSKLDELDIDSFKIAIQSLNNIEIIDTNIKIIDVLTNLNVATSKREAREFLKSNTISINNVIVNDENILLKDIESKFDKYYLIKRGKRKHFIATIK